MRTPSRDAELVDELKRGVAEADRQTAEVKEVTDPLDERQFRRSPTEGGWSVGQCLTHLTLSTGKFLEGVGPAVEEAREHGRLGPGPYRGTLFGRFFLWMLEPPPKLAMKTFEDLQPQPGGRKARVVAGFVSVQEKLTRAMRDADGVDLGGVRLASPMGSWLKWSIGQVFEIALAHNRRHIWQARQVLKHDEFPRDARAPDPAP